MLSHPRGTNTNRTRQNPQAGNRGWVSEPRLYLSLCPSPKCARVRASTGGSDRRAADAGADARQSSCAGRGGGGREGREDRGRCGQAGIYSQARRRRAVGVAGSREPPRRGRTERETARGGVAVRRQARPVFYRVGLGRVGPGSVSRRVRVPNFGSAPARARGWRVLLCPAGATSARVVAPTRPVPFPAVARRRRLARSTVFFSVWHQWRSWP